MYKRIDSRFTNDEIRVVYENWQRIASDYNVKLKVTKTVLSSKSLLAKAIDYKEKDEVYWNLFAFELNIPYKSGVITIRASEAKFPQLSYSIRGKTDLEFYIWKEDFTDKISKLFGMHEMHTGFGEFDKKYFIKTSDETRMRKVLDQKTTLFLADAEICLFKLENSTFEMSASINELDHTEITEFVEAAKYVIDRIG